MHRDVKRSSSDSPTSFFCPVAATGRSTRKTYPVPSFLTSSNRKRYLKNWIHSLLPDQRLQEEEMEGASVVVKIITPARLRHLKNLTDHGVTDSVSSNRPYLTT